MENDLLKLFANLSVDELERKDKDYKSEMDRLHSERGQLRAILKERQRQAEAAKLQAVPNVSVKT